MATERQGEESSAGDIPLGRWGALAIRDFQLFWAQGLLQGLARNMRELLLGFLVFDLTGSKLASGHRAVYDDAV